MKNDRLIFGRIPEGRRKQLLYDGVPNLTDDLYLFHVRPIPTVCHAKVRKNNGSTRVSLTLMAHKRLLTLEEAVSAKQNFFDETETVCYILGKPFTTSKLPYHLTHPMVRGLDRPEIIMYEVPTEMVPDIFSITKNLEFSKPMKLQKTISGKRCVIVYSRSQLEFEDLSLIAEEYFSEALLFHQAESTLLSYVHILWDKADFPELENFLK